MGELVHAAQYRGVTTYQDIAVIMGLPLQGNHMSRETGRMLGEIAQDEFNAGRPMLSAVVVGVDGKPGPGFYNLARGLGRLSDEDDQLVFWEQEREAVYNAWRRPLPKKKKDQKPVSGKKKSAPPVDTLVKGLRVSNQNEILKKMKE